MNAHANNTTAEQVGGTTNIDTYDKAMFTISYLAWRYGPFEFLPHDPALNGIEGLVQEEVPTEDGKGFIISAKAVLPNTQKEPT